MDITTLILTGIFLFFSIYAIYREYTEHDDAFTKNKVRVKDSIWSSLRKLENCLDYDKKTIKWRRTLIATLISMILLFGVFHRRSPSSKEFIIHFFFIFVVFYVMWQNYSDRTASGAVLYGRENIDNIKRQLAEKRRYILPW